MNFYKSWNFFDNPFSPSALPSNDLGRELIVGRDREITQVLRRLYNPPAAVTIEGVNGIGKTSLLNVSIYDAYLQFFERQTQTLYIPCSKTFQISPDKSVEAFLDELFLEVAQTLIRRSEELKNLGYNLPENSVSIDKWLNSPQLSTYQATLGPIGAGRSSETNTSGGFERSGFRNRIQEWLSEIFPQPDFGAVVCVIDNLELLETSDAARKLMERLRDEAFNINGIRWVMCGSLGIIKSIASTPRLEGYLHKPLEVAGVDKKFSAELFSKRIKYFSHEEKVSYVPITPASFSFMYEVFNYNLRNTLHHCDQYCLYVADSGNLPQTEDEKEKEFINWFQDISNSISESISSQIRPRAQRLFDDIIRFGGVFSPSDYEAFGFNSIAALRPKVLELEKVAVVTSSIDETDNRRKTIQITPKGWLASYARKKE